MISAANYPDMTDALRIQWLDAFNSDAELENVKSLYKIEGADGLTGYISSLDGFSPARVKEEGDDLPYLNLTQNYRKSWTTKTIGGMEKITWEIDFLSPALVTVYKKFLKFRGTLKQIAMAILSETRKGTCNDYNRMSYLIG